MHVSLLCHHLHKDSYFLYIFRVADLSPVRTRDNVTVDLFTILSFFFFFCKNAPLADVEMFIGAGQHV